MDVMVVEDIIIADVHVMEHVCFVMLLEERHVLCGAIQLQTNIEKNFYALDVDMFGNQNILNGSYWNEIRKKQDKNKSWFMRNICNKCGKDGIEIYEKFRIPKNKKKK